MKGSIDFGLGGQGRGLPGVRLDALLSSLLSRGKVEDCFLIDGKDEGHSQARKSNLRRLTYDFVLCCGLRNEKRSGARED